VGRTAVTGSYTRPVKVVGLYLVRNEVDVVETNLRHHFDTVLDEAIVIDNGSTDGTLEVVAELARELPIEVASEDGWMYQSERTTRMARYAVLRGADWLIPIDADEFWVGASRPFRQVLEETPDHVLALFVEPITFVQHRGVHTAEPGCVATMTMRPARQIGPVEQAQRMVRDEEIGWVEIRETPKSVHRARPGVFVPQGNHCTGIPGGVPTDALSCFHAPLRARSVMTAKLDQGRRAIEDGSLPDAAWQSKRWWQMGRSHALDREWEALSYRDGAITVAGRRRALVADDRLRARIEAVTPTLRATRARVARPIDEMPPPVAAYLLALDTVPGWFGPLDFRTFVEIDRVQGEHGTAGDIFEVGAYMGRSAILLGHLVREPGERLTVCDVFEHVDVIDPESMPPHNHWYRELTEKAFVEQYQRFHQKLPEILVGRSDTVDAGAGSGTCRVVHVDGGHGDDIVRHDARLARRLLRPGGIVAFGHVSTPHFPGVALAVWELVLSGEFVPLWLTEAKLYGTWDMGDIDWPAAIETWVARHEDLGFDTHTLAGWPVRRLFTMPGPVADLGNLVRIPDLEDMPGGGGT